LTATFLFLTEIKLMQHLGIHPSGPVFSRIITGAWRWQSLSTKEIENLIQTSIDCGITTFDHADIYGDHTVEGLFGQAMPAGIRQKIQLVSKCGIKFPSSHHIIWSAENSLQKLRTDYLDLLLIHRPDPLLDPTEVAEAFIKLRDAGKVLHVGVSNFTPAQISMLQKSLPFPLVTNQIEISLSKTDSFFNGDLDFLMTNQVSPMAWSPLGGGNLVNKQLGNKINLPKASEAQIWLAWLLNHPANIFPVIGTSKPERIVEAANALTVKLDRQQWFALLQEARGYEVP
jgi:predicted oxidoreductase